MKDFNKISNLDQIKKWIHDLKSGQLAVIDMSSFDILYLDKLLELVAENALYISVQSLNSDETSFIGTSDLFGYPKLQTMISFSQLDNALLLSLTITFDASTQWELMKGLHLLITAPVFQLIPDIDCGAMTLLVSSHLKVGNLNMAVELEIPCHDGDWLLTENTSIESSNQATLLDEDSLYKLAGDNDLIGILPTELINWKELYLSGVRIAFHPKELSCKLISVIIKLQHTWKFFDDTFEIDGITLELNVRDLFVKDESPSLDGELYGNLVLVSGQPPIEVGAIFPDAIVFARLPKDSYFQLNAIFTKFQCPLPHGFPDIDISTFEFLFYPLESGFSFQLGIDKPIPMLNQALELESLHLSVEYQKSPAVGFDNFLGYFRVCLLIKTTKVFLSAYYYGKDQGLDLKGRISNLPIGDLLEYLSQKLGIQLPDFVRSMVLNETEIFYNTGSGDFFFDCYGTFDIEGVEVQMHLLIEVTHSKQDHYEFKLQGTISISSGNKVYDFDLFFETSKSASSGFQCFLASYNNQSSEQISIKDLITPLSLEVADCIPEDLVFGIKDLYFVIFKDSATNQNRFIMGIDVSAHFSLSEIELISSVMPVDQSLGMENLQLLLLSRDLSREQLTLINQTLSLKHFSLPISDSLLTGNYLLQAFYIFANLAIGNDKKYINLVLGKKKPATRLLPGEYISTEKVTPPVPKWIDIQKALGPIYFNRLGVAYQDRSIYIDIDASLTLSGLSIHLDGFLVSSPLNKFKPNFSIDGLSVLYQSGPIEIGAGFLRSFDPRYPSTTIYNGEAVIKTTSLSLTGMGSYAFYKNQPSLFVFVLLHYPIGGPPAFIVTGLAGGFGYNRRLILPTIDNIRSFPLIQGAVNPPQSNQNPFKDKSRSRDEVLDVLDDYIPLSIGDYWLAVGVSFTSFRILNSFALMTVMLGTEFELAFLGISTLSFPEKASPPLVQATLMMIATFKPKEGTLAIEARLTKDSYILTTECHLTGGFAFYLWFSPSQYAGDFVVSLGGYHPHFVPPKHYPVVPRLGLNWQVSPELHIKGGLYLALTPSCFMVGGNMEAVWQYKSLKAWFIMNADFIISWKPYYYEAQLNVNFGVSYTFSNTFLSFITTKTITLSSSADLLVWGPEFSVIAHIHLYIISFTISVHNAPKKPKKIGWEEFKDSFLPAVSSTKENSFLKEVLDPTSQKSVCSIRMSEGLIKDLSSVEGGIDWIVCHENSCFITNTAIPSKTYTFSTTAQYTLTQPPSWNTNFGVGLVMVDSKDFASEHAITLTSSMDISNVKFELTPILSNSPKSLWEKREAGFTTDSTIPYTLTGFILRPLIISGDSTSPLDKDLISVESHLISPGCRWITPNIPSTDRFDQTKAINILKETITTTSVKVRATILSDLIDSGFKLDPTLDLSDLASSAEHYLLAPPILSYLGEEKVS